MPQTKRHKKAELFIVAGDKPTLMGLQTSEELDVLRIGPFVNRCADKPEKYAQSSVKQGVCATGDKS